MARRIIAAEAVQGLIRAQLLLAAPCSQCEIGPVLWTPPLGLGCNWRMPEVLGDRDGECLRILLPLLIDLRQNFDIEPAAGPTGRLVRLVSGTSATVRGANDALAESAAILKIISGSRSFTHRQIRASRRALTAVPRRERANPVARHRDGDHPAIKDPKRIDVADSSELDAWSVLLRVSPDEIVEATRAVGFASAAVTVHLGPARRHTVDATQGDASENASRVGARKSS